MSATPQDLLMQLYRAALAAADPRVVLPPHLTPYIHAAKGKTVVVGVGKAASAMAWTLEQCWREAGAHLDVLSGVVIVPEDATLPYQQGLQKIKVLAGTHPIPSAASVAGAEALLQVVSGLSPDDQVLALISGGGSALCALPALGLSLTEKQAITRALLQRGATITEINTVRRHLSAIKGGRLAAHAYPAAVHSFLISDIAGDEVSLIASGPTLPDSSTCGEALKILQRYQIEVSASVQQALARSAWESIKPDDARIQGNTQHLIASAWTGLAAARQKAHALGLTAHILSDAMEGEARDLAKTHAAIALSVAQRGTPFRAPCVLLSGGEATVTLGPNSGRGGRNTEFILALALTLKNQSDQKATARITALSAGSDGLDGRAQAAGAWMDARTLEQARQLGLSAPEALETHDSASLLAATDQLIHTGPTYTNINDFRAILVGG